MMPGYLLAAAFHKQAFASATQHQLLAFLQVAAFTNRTAVLPFARVGGKGGASRTRPRREEEGRTVASRVQVVMDRGVGLLT